MDELQDVQIKKAKPLEQKYFLNDGGGLRLAICPDNKKIWEFRFTINGKRRLTTFKNYPMVSLKNARLKRNEYLDLIALNIDPIEHFKKIKENSIVDENGKFINVSQEWLTREAERTKQSTHKDKMRVFEKDINPFLNNKHIKDININDVIKVITVKNVQSNEVALKIFNYLDNLFRYAVLKGYCDRNILTDIKKSDIIRAKEVKHFSKITDINILTELKESIYNYTGNHSLRNALKLVFHIPLRAENLCTMKWDYINFKEKSLTIPREEMKIKNQNLSDFKIPLTDEVISILEEQIIFTGHQQYVFLGIDNRNHINKESPNRVLQRLGFNDEKRGRKIRLHGFRGTFRSLIETLDEKNKFSYELKERILDHHEKNDTVRAYNHKADYYKQFVPLMEFWSNFICSLGR